MNSNLNKEKTVRADENMESLWRCTFLDEVVKFSKTNRNIKYVNKLRLSFIRVVSISAIPRYG